MRELLTIEPEVFSIIPGLHVVAVFAEHLEAASPAAVDARWAGAWNRVHSEFGFPNPQSHPHVGSWRLAMKGAGASHKQYPTSVEALVRRALKSPVPFRINPLVDFYNSVCLEFVVPAGGFDLDVLPAPLRLRLTRQGDRFKALDGSEDELVPKGELAYVSDSIVVTRHLVWRQSRLGLVTASTRSALFVSEILPDHHRIADQVRESLASGLRDLFGASVHSAVVSKDEAVMRVATGKSSMSGPSLG